MHNTHRRHLVDSEEADHEISISSDLARVTHKKRKLKKHLIAGGTVNYDDINFLIDTLHNFVYHPVERSEYKYLKLLPNDMTSELIKMPSTFNYKQVFDNIEFKFLGIHNNKAVFKRYSNNTKPCNVKIGFYDSDNVNLNDLTRPENVDKIMMLLSSELVVNNETPFILLPIMNFDLELNELKKYPKIYREVIKLRKNSSQHSLYIQITEHYFSHHWLSDYLRQKKLSVTEWRLLLFQVLQVILSLQNKWSNFRHNNLIVENIELYTRTPNKLVYFINETEFNIQTEHAFEIKIAGFENAVIPNLVNNRIAVNLQQNNPYYDFHIFLQSVVKLLGGIPEEIASFCNSVVPREYLKHGQITNLDESLFIAQQISEVYLPANILTRNEFFSEFKASQEEKSVRSASITNDASDNRPLIAKRKIKRVGIVARQEKTNKTQLRKIRKRLLKKRVVSESSDSLSVSSSPERELSSPQLGGSRYRRSLIGGDDLPQATNIKHNPFKPKQEKTLDIRRYQENPPYKKRSVTEAGYRPVVDVGFKYYGDATAQKQKTAKQDLIERVKFPAPQFAQYPLEIPVFNPAQIAPATLPFLTQPAQIPMINQYRIDLSNPAGDHVKVANIFEDILPERKSIDTFNSIDERFKIRDFIRAVLIGTGDGEIIDMTGKSKRSFLSHVKLLNFNPYATRKLQDNPYKNLPYGFMIWNSGFPVQYNPQYGTTMFPSDATALNTRIYRMSNADLYVNKIKGASYLNSEMWREIYYYEYVRQNILLKKLCPNFVMMYTYHRWQGCNIKFDEIAKMSNNPATKQLGIAGITIARQVKPIIPRGVPQDDPTYRLFPRSQLTNLGQRQPLLLHGGDVSATGEVIYDANTLLKDAYSGSAMNVLTEAPTYNILRWASRVYKVDSNIYRMVNTGYYDERIWRSIYFQIIASLCVLQKEGIVIRDFSLADNVYIKDLNTDGNNIGYWRYQIYGINYYVPNYGFIVLIDTNFKDLPLNDGFTLAHGRSRHKIESKMYLEEELKLTENKLYQLITSAGTGNELVINELNQKKNLIAAEIKQIPEILRKEAFENFKRVINTANFGRQFSNDDGVTPPTTITKILELMYTEALNDAEMNIAKYLTEHFQFFMNNRIGTYLNVEEVKNRNPDAGGDFQPGDMVVVPTVTNDFTWGVCIKKLTEGKVRVLFNQSANEGEKKMVIQDGDSVSYYGYPKANLPITQKSRPNEKLGDDDLLDSFVIN